MTKETDDSKIQQTKNDHFSDRMIQNKHPKNNFQADEDFARNKISCLTNHCIHNTQKAGYGKEIIIQLEQYLQQWILFIRSIQLISKQDTFTTITYRFTKSKKSGKIKS